MKFTRRRLLYTSALAASGGLLGWQLDRRVWAASQVSRHVTRYDSIPPCESGSSIDFLVVGDTGADTPERARLMPALEDALERSASSFLILTGDNVYPHGVVSAHDPQWEQHVEKPFRDLDGHVPLFPCLGNHDYESNPTAQIEYSKANDSWHLPAPFHSFKRSAGSVSIEFFVLDTMAIRQRGMYELNADEQAAWLSQAMGESDATYKIAIGHHPTHSGGLKGGSSTVAWHVAHSFVNHDLDLYLSGHNHDLELIDSGRGWFQVVSGAGSLPQSVESVPGTEFCSGCHAGFARISVREEGIWIQFQSEHERLATFLLQRSEVLA